MVSPGDQMLHGCEMGTRAHRCGAAPGGGSLAPTNRHAVYAGNGVRPDRSARRPADHRRGDGRPDECGGAHAGRGDARGGAIRGRVPDQDACTETRVCSPSASAGDRTAAHHRRRCGACRRDVCALECRRGAGLGGAAGAYRCGPWAGGRNRAEPAVAHSTGAQRREWPERRDLRAAVADRARRGRRRGQDGDEPARDQDSGGGDWLRHSRRGGGGVGRRRGRCGRQSPGSHQRLVAASHPARSPAPASPMVLRSRWAARDSSRRFSLGPYSERFSPISPRRPHA